MVTLLHVRCVYLTNRVALGTYGKHLSNVRNVRVHVCDILSKMEINSVSTRDGYVDITVYSLLAGWKKHMICIGFTAK